MDHFLKLIFTNQHMQDYVKIKDGKEAKMSFMDIHFLLWLSDCYCSWCCYFRLFLPFLGSSPNISRTKCHFYWLCYVISSQLFRDDITSQHSCDVILVMLFWSKILLWCYSDFSSVMINFVMMSSILFQTLQFQTLSTKRD